MIKASNVSHLFPHPTVPLISVSLLLAGLQLQDGDAKDTEPIAAEDPEINKELQKTFPEIEGDVAPHAIAPKAMTSITKQIAKLEAVLQQFKVAESMTKLQTAKLVYNSG